MMTTKLQTLINTSMMGMIAAVGLSGCVVSDDPVVNGVATAATVGAVATLFYSISDGYYYDSYYQRMPRGYRPQKNVVVHRIENIEIYRQQHPLNSRRIMQPNRMENQRMPVGYQMNPGQGHWNQQDRFGSQRYPQQTGDGDWSQRQRQQRQQMRNNPFGQSNQRAEGQASQRFEARQQQRNQRSSMQQRQPVQSQRQMPSGNRRPFDFEQRDR